MSTSDTPNIKGFENGKFYKICPVSADNSVIELDGNKLMCCDNKTLKNPLPRIFRAKRLENGKFLLEDKHSSQVWDYYDDLLILKLKSSWNGSTQQWESVLVDGMQSQYLIKTCGTSIDKYVKYMGEGEQIKLTESKEDATHWHLKVQVNVDSEPAKVATTNGPQVCGSDKKPKPLQVLQELASTAETSKSQ